MLLKRRRHRFPVGRGVLVWGSMLAGACGSRGEGYPQFFGDPLPALPPLSGEPCVDDRDCEIADPCFPRACLDGLCVDLEPVVCDDGDECTEDVCSESGACEHLPLTFDLDGDGYLGPRPGFAPGSPGACGDDCDDTSARAFPGGTEVCDGVDNDCNGVIDEDAEYVPVGDEPLLVSEGTEEASAGDLAYNGSFYGAVFAGESGAWENTFKGIEASGATAVPSRAITNVNTDTFTGPLVWNGAIYGTAWEDRRDGDFEIYFNRLTSTGEKLGPDVRVTNARDFSLRPSMIWDGRHFVVVWADRRNGRDDYRVYGQRIDAEGELVGGNVELTVDKLNADAPSLAKGTTTLGVAFAYSDENSGARRIGFLLLTPDLIPGLAYIGLSGDHAVDPSVVFTGDRYVVAWSLRDVTPGGTIQGAAIDEAGRVIVSETALTSAAPFARSQSMLPLGDRLILAWSEEHNGSYNVYTKMLGLDLTERTPARQVTFSAANATAPIAAFGPDGDVGILYEDDATGSFQVYFTRLSCAFDGGG